MSERIASHVRGISRFPMGAAIMLGSGHVRPASSGNAQDSRWIAFAPWHSIVCNVAAPWIVAGWPSASAADRRSVEPRVHLADDAEKVEGQLQNPRKQEAVADRDLSPEWIEEITRRLDDIESGRVKCISEEEAARMYPELFRRRPGER